MANFSVWVRLRPRRSSSSLLCQEAGRSRKRVEATLAHRSARHVEGLRQSLPQRHPDCTGQNPCRLSAQSVYCEHAQTKLRECEPWKRSHREGEMGPRRPPRCSRVSLPVHSGDRDGFGVVARFLGRTRPGYLIDGFWLPEVAYADDVVLLAMSIAALQTMLLEVEQVFAAVGLTRVLWRVREQPLSSRDTW